MEQEKANAIRKQLHELLDLALDINSFEPRQKETTGSKPTVFMEFHGQVNQIVVNISIDGWKADGWKEGIYPEEFVKAYLDKPIPEEQMNALRAYHKEVCHERI